eukprot:scaffold21749_cov62-Isochrysis_galbana.AAC.1
MATPPDSPPDDLWLRSSCAPVVRSRMAQMGSPSRSACPTSGSPSAPSDSQNLVWGRPAAEEGPSGGSKLPNR